ncbi:hypothetical protein NDU88_003061 [Pleurodeles waltl]|uniref:Uncharacterized protein n=1 Tax=Pleurodeles waltl TaxID=8319 RepID=A0AAV7SEW5_PLEWA|nr:hypothetical protein NDU88_003061 [Pleurodeles waltl]
MRREAPLARRRSSGVGGPPSALSRQALTAGPTQHLGRALHRVHACHSPQLLRPRILVGTARSNSVPLGGAAARSRGNLKRCSTAARASCERHRP